MKIEIGESLFYSWLRHIKKCQIVQSNWRPSPKWTLHNNAELERFMSFSNEHYARNFGYDVFKNNTLTQLITQAEMDLLGISFLNNEMEIYSVDVAYHENGLNYGDRKENSGRVIKKFLRTALCLWGYFNTTKGEIIFSSPKINNAIWGDLEYCVTDVNRLFETNALDFTAKMIANNDFNELVIKPILIESHDISDTSELFLRSFKLLQMFDSKKNIKQSSEVVKKTNAINFVQSEDVHSDELSELKIGVIVRTVLRKILESGVVAKAEIEDMLTKNYSKQTFHIDYPLLVLGNAERDSARYYADPLEINGERYFLCNDWYEKASNNDRPFLLKWLKDNTYS